MTDFELHKALTENRKTWLAGLSVGSKILLGSYVAKVFAVERTTKTQFILNDGVRLSRRTGVVLGNESMRAKQLLTCSPQFQPGTDFDVGRTLIRYEERMVAECVVEMVTSGLTSNG